MAISSYTSIVTAVKEIIEDDSEEVSAFIKKAIFLAEEVVAKDLDMTRMEATVSLSTQVSASAYDRPHNKLYPVSVIDDSDFLYFNHVFQNGRKLTRVDYSFIEEFNRAEGSVYGTSAMYWSFNTTPSVIMISPQVSGRVGNFKCNYTKRPTQLSPAEQTNQLTRSAPDLLLFQTMVQMGTFLKNWDSLPVWQQQYQQSLQSHLNTTRRERKEVGQMNVTDRDNNQSTTGAR